jgi:predicted metal-dependent phosphoesterase TrpH
MEGSVCEIIDVRDTEGESSYKYETHLHTKEASACGLSTGAEMVHAHKAAGYCGIIITDHFFNGNCGIPSHLPWKERVNRFCKGYENALEEGKRVGLQVFFGWEYGYYGTEFLTYGLDKEFLLAYPDMLNWRIEKYFDIVHQHRGFIAHAHPFRQAPYIEKIRLFPQYVDAVEIINSSHKNPEYDEKALKYALENSLLQISGSDSHNANTLFGGGMEFPSKLSSIKEFVQAVRSGDGVKHLQGYK